MALSRMGFGGGRRAAFDPPIELRFVDLFMILLTGFIFITVVLSLVAALGGHGDEVRSPEIYTTVVPEAIAGRNYTVALAAVGGSGDYRWTFDGQAPDGLALSEAGLLAGAFKTSGTVMMRIIVTDRSGRQASRDLKVAVLPAIKNVDQSLPTMHVLADAVLPDGQDMENYHHTLAVAGGVAPYSWEPKDSIPKGLSISTGGELTGKPEGANTHTFKLEVRDATGAEAVQQFRLYVRPRPPAAWRRILSWGITAAWMLYLWQIFWRGGYTPGLKSWLDERRARARY